MRYRESNFLAHSKSWHNATDPFASVARVALNTDWAVVQRDAGAPHWFEVTKPMRIEQAMWSVLGIGADGGPARAPPREGGGGAADGALGEDAGGPSAAAAAAATAEVADADLLLVHFGFAANGQFSNPYMFGTGEGFPKEVGWMREFYREMRWCGKALDLQKPASKTMGGFDCYGQGKYIDTNN